MKGLFKSKKRSIFALAADRRGVFAILFAAMLPALIITVGAAIDYSAAISQKMRMQSALDAAVLAGSVAARNALNLGYNNTIANTAGQSAATSFYNSNGNPGGTLTTSFPVSGLTVTGIGSVTATMKTSFMGFIGVSTMTLTVSSQTATQAQPYLQVYLLVDISTSMLLPSTMDGINSMMAGQGGCALACHDNPGNDSYAWALKNGIQLRYQVVNLGVLNLLSYLNSNPIYQAKVQVGLWSLDSAITQYSGLTSNFTAVANNFPAPGVAYNDAAAATPFNTLIPNFVSMVGSAGDGSSWSKPKKLVILATDGVNDPTRAWTSNVPLRAQVKVFDTTFCTNLQAAGVTVAIINTPYYPMPWDWGYVATLGQPGTLGGQRVWTIFL